jgi:tol-pal system protein YbgF
MFSKYVFYKQNFVSIIVLSEIKQYKTGFTMVLKIVTTALVLMSSTASMAASNAWLPSPFKNSSSQLLVKTQYSPQAEEQIRLLNGKIEEMNFLILQLQEQLRKTQEDNEFRFQELEKSTQASSTLQKETKDTSLSTEKPTEDAPVAPQTVLENGRRVSPVIGLESKNLGSLKFDENGNAIASSIEEVIIPSTQDEASTPAPTSAKDVYRAAYDHVLAGEYAQAETGFRDYMKQFPKDEKNSDARYWLGESLAGQEKHKEAAEVLLSAQRDFPKSKKAPDMLLKLGVSLAALDNKDVACATFAQVSKKYPKAGPTLLSRVSEEQSKAGC